MGARQLSLKRKLCMILAVLFLMMGSAWFPSACASEPDFLESQSDGSAGILPNTDIVTKVSLVDPQSIGIVGLTATPLIDVSGWKPLNLSATSPGTGSWSVRILSPGGDDVTSAGVLSITSPNPGTAFTANWVPYSYYSLTGTHQAAVQLTDGTSTVTATVTFAVYNFTVRIRSVSFTDATFHNPIVAPKARQNFGIKVEFQNVGLNALPLIFTLVMVGNQYMGGGGMGNIFPGQMASTFSTANVATAGNYTLRAFAWTGPGGAALAQPLILSITVLP